MQASLGMLSSKRPVCSWYPHHATIAEQMTGQNGQDLSTQLTLPDRWPRTQTRGIAPAVRPRGKSRGCENMLIVRSTISPPPISSSARRSFRIPKRMTRCSDDVVFQVHHYKSVLMARRDASALVITLLNLSPSEISAGFSEITDLPSCFRHPGQSFHRIKAYRSRHCLPYTIERCLDIAYSPYPDPEHL